MEFPKIVYMDKETSLYTKNVNEDDRFGSLDGIENGETIAVYKLENVCVMEIVTTSRLVERIQPAQFVGDEVAGKGGV